MAIKCKAVLSNLSEGTSTYYRLVPTETKKISEAEFLAALATKAGQDTIQARYWMDAFRDCLYTKLAENLAVDLNFLYAKLFVGGSLASASDQPTKEANPVRPRIFAKGALADALAAIEVENDTLAVAAILYEIMQDDASGVNRIEAVNKRVVINGSAIKIESTREDEGVWLENIDTGIVVKQGTVTYSDSSTAYVTFASLPSTGRYRLVLATRNGEDPAVYSLAKATRNVYVVNG